MKWIIDSHGAIHHAVVKEGDSAQSHADFWPGRVSAHGKWRWQPNKPYHINTYGEDIEDDDLFRIHDIILKYS